MIYLLGKKIICIEGSYSVIIGIIDYFVLVFFVFVFIIEKFSFVKLL